jgi:hypothetical protein
VRFSEPGHYLGVPLAPNPMGSRRNGQKEGQRLRRPKVFFKESKRYTIRAWVSINTLRGQHSRELRLTAPGR